jgi:membrane-associated phospholipid phosphatase
VTDIPLTLLVLGLLAAALLLAWGAAHLLRRLSLTAVQRLPPVLRWLARQRLVARVAEGLSRRFPRTAAFVADRFRTDRFAGLPLTLVAAAAAYLAALLGGLVEELLEAEEIVAVDEAVNDAFTPYRVAPLVQIVGWITRLADSASLTAVAAVTSAFLLSFHAARLLLPLWVTVLGANISTWAGKFAFDRPRPEFVTEVTAISASFPSGHATGAMAVYGFIAYLLARDRSRARTRFEILFWSAALIAVIALSRMYLSVHFASDVAAGLLVGGFWLLVGIAITELRRTGRPH